MKTQELMNLIDQTAQDFEVKKDTNLSADLAKAHQELVDGRDLKGVALGLNDDLSWYLMTHEYKAPQAIMNLIKVMQNDANSFWKGTGISTLFR